MVDTIPNVPSILDQVASPINMGYAILGDLLGQKVDVYRPNSANNPIDPINHQQVQSVLFSFDPGFALKKPRDYKSTQMYASLDRTNALNGDYLVNQVTSLIYFINSEESITPTGVQLTNNVLTFYRPTEQETGGYISNRYNNPNLNTYSGNVDNFGTILATNWPVSFLIGTKGERQIVNLPDQSRSPWYAAKLPLIPGVLLQTNDLAIDKDGIRYLLSSVEETTLGYNLTMDQSMV